MNQPTNRQPELSRSDRTMVLVVSALGGFLVTFMASSINIALPLIGVDFHVSAAPVKRRQHVFDASPFGLPLTSSMDRFYRSRSWLAFRAVFSLAARGGFALSVPFIGTAFNLPYIERV